MARTAKNSGLGPSANTGRGLRFRYGLMVGALFVSVAFLLASGLAAQEAEDQVQKDSTEENERRSTPISPPGSLLTPRGGLRVPVYPRDSLRKKEPGEQTEVDLQSSYIILKDGSALSMADWILGSLQKDQAGADMSDYQNRLFLGQVARASVGMDETLVHRSVVSVGPLVTYKAPPPPKGAEAVLRGVAGLIMGAILPGTPEGWHPAKAGGAFNPMMKSGGDAAILFENQFHDAMMHTAGEFKERGTMQDMLDKAIEESSENGNQ